ncbi:MAG: AzlD domain-containing protein [Lachnospiraceae bacterium]|nr:AzlD domain-containing protein [Lachnospiraceae bacterium]
MPSPYVWILVMFLTSITIRVLPLTLFRKPIENTFFKSFLYYVPYVTLAVMTFPAIVDATQVPAAGAAAFVIAILCAVLGADLFKVAIVSCAAVFILEMFLI